MKRFTTLLLLVLAVVLSAQAQSQVKQFTLKSKLLGVEKNYTVYLPDGYAKSSQRYPVLYLLHGANGDHLSWADPRGGNMQAIADKTIAQKLAKKMIIVLPDASGEDVNNGGKNMGYFNVSGWAYMDFFFKEFIPHIDKTFRTIATKEGRAVAGLSMGGGGAVVYAQNYPEIFNAAYSTSGLLDHRSCASILGRFGEVWAASVAQYSPVTFLRKATPATLEKLRSVRWLVECGDDDWIIYTNLDFYTEMKRVRVPFDFRIREGVHSWKFWRESLPNILAFSFE